MVIVGLMKFVIGWNIIQKSLKSFITDSINHYFVTIRIDSYNSLPIEKILTFHNFTILVKSVVNKNENHYYYNIFLERGL